MHTQISTGQVVAFGFKLDTTGMKGCLLSFLT